MEQKEFLNYILNLSYQLKEVTSSKENVIQVKKTYKGKNSLLTSNGQGKNARIKLKGKKPNVSFRCIGTDKNVWNVTITPQTVKSACSVFLQKNINLLEDTEDEISEKLEYPFLKLDRAKELEVTLLALSKELLSLKSKVQVLEDKLQHSGTSPLHPDYSLLSFDCLDFLQLPQKRKFVSDEENIHLSSAFDTNPASASSEPQQPCKKLSKKEESFHNDKLLKQGGPDFWFLESVIDSNDHLNKINASAETKADFDWFNSFHCDMIVSLKYDDNIGWLYSKPTFDFTQSTKLSVASKHSLKKDDPLNITTNSWKCKIQACLSGIVTPLVLLDNDQIRKAKEMFKNHIFDFAISELATDRSVGIVNSPIAGIGICLKYDDIDANNLFPHLLGFPIDSKPELATLEAHMGLQGLFTVSCIINSG